MQRLQVLEEDVAGLRSVRSFYLNDLNKSEFGFSEHVIWNQVQTDLNPENPKTKLQTWNLKTFVLESGQDILLGALKTLLSQKINSTPPGSAGPAWPPGSD